MRAAAWPACLRSAFTTASASTTLNKGHSCVAGLAPACCGSDMARCYPFTPLGVTA